MSKYLDTLPLHRNVQNLGLGLKSRGRGRIGTGPRSLDGAAEVRAVG